LRKILVWGINSLNGDDLKSIRSKNLAPETIPVPTSKRILAKYDVALRHRSLDHDHL
jgi:hypothetical protein